MRAKALCYVLTLAAFSYTGCAAPTSGHDDSSSQALAGGNAASDEDFIGDEGPGWDRPEVDPTRAPGYVSPSEKRGFAPADVPVKAVLNFTWHGQETHYWCGPGSVHMAIGTRIADPPSETKLADFMGTTTAGTVRDDAIRALNNWLTPPTPYVSVPVDSPPTQAQRDLLKQTILDRIGGGYPVIANVHSGWRPPFYPSGNIGHFVAVVGYDQSGDMVLIADPAADGSGGHPRWDDVPESYWIATEDLGSWVGSRGYSQ
jgi:hypothetical protein